METALQGGCAEERRSLGVIERLRSDRSGPGPWSLTCHATLIDPSPSPLGLQWPSQANLFDLLHGHERPKCRPGPPTGTLSQTATMTDSAARQLNVADALIYLDLVENRFRERPEVYKQFLDIMKEYKGQTYVICCLQNFLAAKNEQN